MWTLHLLDSQSTAAGRPLAPPHLPQRPLPRLSLPRPLLSLPVLPPPPLLSSLPALPPPPSPTLSSHPALRPPPPLAPLLPLLPSLSMAEVVLEAEACLLVVVVVGPCLEEEALGGACLLVGAVGLEEEALAGANRALSCKRVLEGER